MDKRTEKLLDSILSVLVAIVSEILKNQKTENDENED